MKNKSTTKGSFSNILMERQEELFLLSFVVSLFVLYLKKSIRFKICFYYIPALIYYYFFIKSASTVKGLSDHILFFGGCKIS